MPKTVKKEKQPPPLRQPRFYHRHKDRIVKVEKEESTQPTVQPVSVDNTIKVKQEHSTPEPMFPSVRFSQRKTKPALATTPPTDTQNEQQDKEAEIEPHKEARRKERNRKQALRRRRREESLDQGMIVPTHEQWGAHRLGEDGLERRREATTIQERESKYHRQLEAFQRQLEASQRQIEANQRQIEEWKRQLENDQRSRRHHDGHGRSRRRYDSNPY
ncbi:hypothetical protein BJ508DRAFT_327643 [Ascobolus immersus RN42]|uniref:Uncharacterized protein n=1 Tax=Ascobolus immersus RN42 TaxID=1160509 RepID=A0A3N4I7K6_ASCIM|nr:hypothetical protein BJ508DRAFT_327643 [Ascobolus immersus RN42]